MLQHLRNRKHVQCSYRGVCTCKRWNPPGTYRNLPEPAGTTQNRHGIYPEPSRSHPKPSRNHPKPPGNLTENQNNNKNNNNNKSNTGEAIKKQNKNYKKQIKKIIKISSFHIKKNRTARN